MDRFQKGWRVHDRRPNGQAGTILYREPMPGAITSTEVYKVRWDDGREEGAVKADELALMKSDVKIEELPGEPLEAGCKTVTMKSTSPSSRF
jgi:hypothetical protein